jgi:hypothetical protein
LKFALPHAGDTAGFSAALPAAKLNVFNVYDPAAWRLMEEICRAWAQWDEPTKSFTEIPKLTGLISITALAILQHFQSRPMKKVACSCYSCYFLIFTADFLPAGLGK